MHNHLRPSDICHDECCNPVDYCLGCGRVCGDIDGDNCQECVERDRLYEAELAAELARDAEADR